MAMHIVITGEAFDSTWERLDVGSMMEAMMETNHKRGLMYFRDGEKLLMVKFQKPRGIDSAQITQTIPLKPTSTQFLPREVAALYALA
jgi:hypothetical protein